MIKLKNRWKDLDEIWYGSMAYEFTLKSHISISYNRKHQHGGRSNFWGKTDTNVAWL
jgi:hypothetical protein